MPQLAPYTLELQWNSTAVLVMVVVVCLACYTLPLVAKLTIARTHLTI